MTTFSRSAVTITNQFHVFKWWSQLKNEAKGEYLEGWLHVPESVKKIELALYAKDGKDGHPCLLFVTPHKKNSKVRYCSTIARFLTRDQPHLLLFEFLPHLLALFYVIKPNYF